MIQFRGPVTAEGKTRSSANALKHGRSNSSRPTSSNPNPFTRSRRLAGGCAAHGAVETGLFDSQIDKQSAALRETCAHLDEGTRLAAAFTALADDTSALNLVTRYETRLRRSFQSAFDRLEAHRARKQKITERTGSVHGPEPARTMYLPA